MIASLFRDLLGWFAGLIESVSVVAAILLVGLIAGMTGFWLLARGLRKLAGPPAELDSAEDALDQDSSEQLVSIERDDDSPTEH